MLLIATATHKILIEREYVGRDISQIKVKSFDSNFFPTLTMRTEWIKQNKKQKKKRTNSVKFTVTDGPNIGPAASFYSSTGTMNVVLKHSSARDKFNDRNSYCFFQFTSFRCGCAVAIFQCKSIVIAAQKYIIFEEPILGQTTSNGTVIPIR